MNVMPKNCAACRERLPELLEYSSESGSRLTPGAPADLSAVAEHVAGCADCTRELALLRAICGELQALPIMAAPTDLRSRIRAELQEAPAQPTRGASPNIWQGALAWLRPPARLAWGGSLVLAAFCLLYVALPMRDSFGPEPSTEMVDAKSDSAAPAGGAGATNANRDAKHAAAKEKSPTIARPVPGRAGLPAPAAPPGSPGTGPQAGSPPAPPMMAGRQPNLDGLTASTTPQPRSPRAEIATGLVSGGAALRGMPRERRASSASPLPDSLPSMALDSPDLMGGAMAGDVPATPEAVTVSPRLSPPGDEVRALPAPRVFSKGGPPSAADREDADAMAGMQSRTAPLVTRNASGEKAVANIMAPVTKPANPNFIRLTLLPRNEAAQVTDSVADGPSFAQRRDALNAATNSTNVVRAEKSDAPRATPTPRLKGGIHMRSAGPGVLGAPGAQGAGGAAGRQQDNAQRTKSVRPESKTNEPTASQTTTRLENAPERVVQQQPKGLGGPQFTYPGMPAAAALGGQLQELDSDALVVGERRMAMITVVPSKTLDNARIVARPQGGLTLPDYVKRVGAVTLWQGPVKAGQPVTMKITLLGTAPGTHTLFVELLENDGAIEDGGSSLVVVAR